jgi:NADH pyrophosphatase NudC (nudix superfamily)
MAESVLLPNEKAVLQEKCRLVVGSMQRDGALILSDQDRIVFVRTRGTLTKTYKVIHFCQVRYVRNVRLEPKFLGKETLVVEWVDVDEGGALREYRYQGLSDPEAWRTQIISRMQQTSQDTAYMQTFLASLSSKEVVPLTELAEIIAASGSFACPQCNVQITKHIRYCGNCGSPVAEPLLTITKRLTMNLIHDGTVNGIIDDEKGAYVSRTKLARETVIKEYKIQVDFQSLKTQLESKGLLLQVLECPHCGGKVNVPTSGDFTQCQHCNRNIYAVDILDKFKSLL